VPAENPGAPFPFNKGGGSWSLRAIYRPSPTRRLLVAGVLTGLVGGAWYAAEEPTSEADRPVLRGQVLGEGGHPLIDAVIRFKPVRSDDDRATRKSALHVVYSGEDGRFSTEGTTDDSFDVRIHAAGYAFRTEHGVDPSEPLSVQLVRGLRLTGRVLAETTGHGIAGATVRIDDDESFALGGTELETSTDKEGRYAFANAPPGVVWVRASAGGRRPVFDSSRG
jgi:hypothetical protein